MYHGYVFEFRCSRSLLEMMSIWNSSGPFQWKAWDSETYGTCIVSRIAECQGKLRVMGEPPAYAPDEYSLEIGFEAEPGRLEETKSALFESMFDRLLPAVGARNVRETTQQPKPGKEP